MPTDAPLFEGLLEPEGEALGHRAGNVRQKIIEAIQKAEGQQ